MPPEPTQPTDVANLVPGQRDHELGVLAVLMRRAQKGTFGRGPGERERDEGLRLTAISHAAVAAATASLAAALQETGSAVALAQAPEAEPVMAQLLGGPGTLTAAELEVALEEAGQWIAEGLDVRTILDRSYPARLREVLDPPLLVFLEGAYLEERDTRAVAVVGSREASPEGLDQARRVARGLAAGGYTIVSGLARGIDAAAQEAALAAGGRTIAVLGAGLRSSEAEANTELAREIVARGGALVSSFLPHQGPERKASRQRNAVIAGLSLGTVVVEAGPRSQAAVLARRALRQGRRVFLLRLLVESQEWARQLIESGKLGTRAVVVAEAGEIVDALEAVAPLSDPAE